MKQQKLLKKLNNLLYKKKLGKIYYSSFYINDELVNLFNVLYLEFDNLWFHCTVSERKIAVYEIKKPSLVCLENILDDFKYPIIEIHSSIIKTNFYNKPIFSLSIKETKEVFGLLFTFNDKNSIFFYENEVETNNLKIIIEDTTNDNIIGTAHQAKPPPHTK